MQRRRFLSAAATAAAALVLPERLLADPYAPPPVPRAPGAPVRVTGRVRAGGRGVAGVGVSDGYSTVRTGRDGRYALLAHPSAAFVSVVAPAGFRIPTHGIGTGRLHRQLVQDARGETALAFDLDRGPPDDRHAFVLLADTQTQNAFEMSRLHAETVPDVRATVAGLGDAVFGVACGDIMYDDLSLYPEYERAVAAMGVPFFQVVGNHDLDFAGRTDEASVGTFESRFGPGHYAFDRGEIHYMVLDDVLWHGDGYVGYLDAAQLAWVASDLALVERGRTVVVCLHIPLASSRPARTGDESAEARERVNNREALYRLLEPYRAHVLSGHTHEHEHVIGGGVHEHVHGAVCGAWWSGDICWDGTPNGYGVYEAAGAGLRWRYKATGQPTDHRLRLYPRGADPTAPGDVVANVWEWDPEWTVVWYENGEPRGLMSRRTGLDPRSVAEHTGLDRPARRGWVEPTPTHHLFYAPAGAEGAEVRVEATDREGVKYSAAL